MKPLLPFDLAARQSGVIHRRQLIAFGLDDQMVRRAVARSALVPVDGDVFLVAGAPPTWHRRLWVDLLLAAPGSVVSHRTASQVHRVGRFFESQIDVLELEEAKHFGRPRCVHRTTCLPPAHRTVVDGLPVTTLARTIFDLASLSSPARRRRGLAHVSERQVERALDDALMRQLKLAELEAVLADLGGRGRPGTRLVRDLVRDRSDGQAVTESELEDLLEAVLEQHGMPKPVRQADLGGDERPVGRVDFAFLAERVVIEADGRRYHGALIDAEADRWRDLELAAAGFVVIRVTWRQLVDDPTRFVDALRALLAARRPT